MAWETPGFKLPGHTAAADLSALQYTTVDVTAAGQVNAATAAGEIVGILQNKPTAGQTAEVMVSGVSKAIAGGAIAVGDMCEVATGGSKLVTVSTGIPVAKALTAAAADGDIFTVLLYGSNA